MSTAASVTVSDVLWASSADSVLTVLKDSPTKGMKDFVLCGCLNP